MLSHSRTRYNCKRAAEWIEAGATDLSRAGRSMRDAVLVFKIAPVSLSYYVSNLPPERRALILKEGRRNEVLTRPAVKAVYWILDGPPDMIRTLDAASEFFAVSETAIRNAAEALLAPGMLPQASRPGGRKIVQAQIDKALDILRQYPTMSLKEVARKYGLSSRQVFIHADGIEMTRRLNAQCLLIEAEAKWVKALREARRINRMRKECRLRDGPSPENAPQKLPTRPTSSNIYFTYR